MEDRFQLAQNGQSVLEADLELLGEVSALADDRVFAEMFRATPYNGSTVARGVLPYAHATQNGTAALVAPNGASGSVLVNPFRALIGSRTAVASDAKKNWRDIRTAIGVGTTTLAQTVAIGANASGNPRWDLVYAAVAVDANGASVTRKVKDPTTKVISSQNVVTTQKTTVTLGVTAGTAAANPDGPAAPPDAGGTYYIPLAYVRVPNGFGASSTVLDTDLGVIASTIRLSNATGGRSLAPANSLFKQGGAAISNARIQTWGSSGTRPHYFAPSTLSGGDSLLIALDLTTGSLSHADLSVIDDSRDWRGRLCKWVAAVGTDPFAWSGSTLAVTPFDTSAETLNVATRPVTYGIGHTLASGGASQDPVVARLRGDDLASMAASSDVEIRCNRTTGALELKIVAGAPNCKIFVWVDFTGPVDNHNRD
jgi:hypothetical protein